MKRDMEESYLQIWCTMSKEIEVIYKVFNKTYQPIRLVGRVVLERKFVLLEKITPQMKNLERKGLLLIKKMK